MSPTPNTPGSCIFTRHWLSMLGVGLIATSALSLLFLALQEVGGHADNPYSKSISQDCNIYHELLAMEGASPEILRTLGIVDRL